MSRLRFGDSVRWRIRNRLKRSPLARRLAGKEPLPRALRKNRRGAAPVLAGRAVSSDRRQHLPIVLFVLVGLDSQGSTEWIRAVARRQAMTQAFLALFVVDRAPFSDLRDEDFTFEYVPSRSDWEGTTLREDWTGFLTRRLREIERSYQPDLVIPVGRETNQASVWATVDARVGEVPDG